MEILNTTTAVLTMVEQFHIQVILWKCNETYLKGGEIKPLKNNGGDVTGAKLY